MDRIILVQEEPRGPSQLVEIPVATNGRNRVPIPNQQNLQNDPNLIITIKSIRLITDKILSNAPTDGAVTAPLAELRKMSLVIYCEGWEKGYLIPVLTLNDIVDADSANATTIPYVPTAPRFDDWKNVDWTKSYLLYSNGTVSANAPYTVIFDVQYDRINKNGQSHIGPS